MPGLQDFALRPICESDLDLILAWRNSERIRAVSYTDHLISPAEHLAWFRRVSASDDSMQFIFSCNEQPCGVVQITDIDRARGTCSWGFYVGASDPAKGTGTVMGILALDYVFQTLQMCELVGEAFAFNAESIRFHKRLGFVKEGAPTKSVFKNGRQEEVVALTLHRADWLSIRPTLVQRFLNPEKAACQQ